MKLNYIILITLLSLTVGNVNAQNSSLDDRTFGLTASIQNENLDFQLPIWLNQNLVIAPVTGLVYAQDFGMDLTLGMVLKSYFTNSQEAVPYVSFKSAAIFGIPDEGDTITDFIIGVGFGGEYFFNPKFSIGIEYQGNASISDEGSFRFGNAGNLNFNTATQLSASIYF